LLDYFGLKGVFGETEISLELVCLITEFLLKRRDGVVFEVVNSLLEIGAFLLGGGKLGTES